MNCKLIAFDLDGTLLDDYKKIPEDNLHALKTAGSKGILIVPASGRLYPFLPEALKKLPGARYFITANGNGVYDAAEDRLIYEASIEIDDALQLADYLEEMSIPYDCYADDVGYAQKDLWNLGDTYFKTPEMNNMFHSYIKVIRTPVDSIRDFIAKRGSSLQKMQMYFPDTDLEEKYRMLELLPRKFPHLVFSSSLLNNIEVNSIKATKGQALSALCGRLGIDLSETVAFGDGTNDLDMITCSGNGVAMINGAEPVKAAAKALSEADNNNAGVARTLEKMGIV